MLFRFGAIANDFVVSVRSLRNTPWFFAVAVLTLALGIGANATLFSMLDAVLLHPLPYRDSNRIVEVWGANLERSGMRVPGDLVEALRERSRTLEAIALHGPDVGELVTGDGPVRITGRHVSANYFDVLGVSPAFGRNFVSGEDAPDAPAVMIVSHAFWQRQLGSDVQVLNSVMDFSGRPMNVVGVMPPEFSTSFALRRDDYWTPSSSEDVRLFEAEIGYEVTARLAPDVTLEEARQEFELIRAGLALEQWDAGVRLDLVRRIDEVVGDSAAGLELLALAVAIVLGIACANLALLSVVRSYRRSGEFATRKAIGASQFQLIRLVMIESVVIAGTGALGGVVLSQWLRPVLVSLAPAQIPRIADSVIDFRVFCFATGLALVTAIAFGIGPALRLSRVAPVSVMRQAHGRATAKGALLRNALIVFQLSASVGLLVLAGLTGRTFITLLPSDPGFDAQSLSVFLVSMLPVDLFDGPEERLAATEDAINRLRAQPGILDVGIGTNVPFVGDDGFRPVRDADSVNSDAEFLADIRSVSTNYLEILGMSVSRGRAFTADDRGGNVRVAMVNQTLAGRLASDGNAIGHTIEVRDTLYEIVGVVADSRSSARTTDIWNEVYLPYLQTSSLQFYLIIQSPLQSAAVDEIVREELRAVTPRLPDDPNQRAAGMQDVLSSSLAAPRFIATLIGAFSGNALLLAAMGVFGVVGYSVSERRTELGIRSALGASPQRLLLTTMGGMLRLIALGVGGGVVVAAYLTRFVEDQLYGVERLDMPTFLVAVAVMAGVAALAAYIPARRATHVGPTTAI